MDHKLEAIIRKTFHIESTRELPDDLKAGDIPEWDSFGSIVLIAALEEEYQIRFTQEDMILLDRLDEIEKAIKNYTEKASNQT